MYCTVLCRHVMCEVITIRLPGSHGGAWQRVEVCATYHRQWGTITINTLSYEQLENIWANCWFLITDLLGSVIHSYSLKRGGFIQNWTKDLFACIAKWKIALEQPHAFCVWSGGNTLGSADGGHGATITISLLMACFWNVAFHFPSTFCMLHPMCFLLFPKLLEEVKGGSWVTA